MAVVLVTVLGGFAKGATGFAMPIVMASGLAALVPPDVALAALILPTLALNLIQGTRGGVAAAATAFREFWRFLLALVATIAASAQFVAVIQPRTLTLMVGVPVVAFAIVMLSGIRFSVPPRRRGLADILVGGFAGTIGGMTAIYGPPTVMYLTALNVPKREHMRVQGIAFGVGALTLFFAHLASGVLTAETTTLSALLILPGLLGIRLGFAISDRLDQRRFRQLTLLVLMLAGLNLVRRGLFI